MTSASLVETCPRCIAWSLVVQCLVSSIYTMIGEASSSRSSHKGLMRAPLLIKIIGGLGGIPDRALEGMMPRDIPSVLLHAASTLKMQYCAIANIRLSCRGVVMTGTMYR